MQSAWNATEGLIIRLITLNALKASDEISEEQSRQVCRSPFRPLPSLLGAAADG
jgi:hypothetical protein